MSAVKTFAPNGRFQDMKIPGSKNLGFMRPMAAFDTVLNNTNSSGQSLIDNKAANILSIQVNRDDHTMMNNEESDLCSP